MNIYFEFIYPIAIETRQIITEKKVIFLNSETEIPLVVIPTANKAYSKYLKKVAAPSVTPKFNAVFENCINKINEIADRSIIFFF